MSDITSVSRMLGDIVVKYFNPAADVKLMTQEMLDESNILIPFSPRPGTLGAIAAKYGVLSYRLAAFAESSFKAALLTVYFGALELPGLDEPVALVGTDDQPQDSRQWLSCAGVVRNPFEVLEFLKGFTSSFQAEVSIKLNSQGRNIMAVEKSQWFGAGLEAKYLPPSETLCV